MVQMHLPTAAPIVAITQNNYRTRTLTLDAITVDDFESWELRSAGYAELVERERGASRAVA